MQKATLADKEWLVEIIANAFRDNLSANWVVKNDPRKILRIERLNAYAFDRSNRSGGAFISEDRKGAMLYLDPEGKADHLQNALNDIRSAFNALGIERSLKVLTRERYVSRFDPKKPFIYLWFIGVRKSDLGLGGRKRLLQALWRSAGERVLPNYLETSAKETVPLHKSAGFEAYHEWNDGFPGFLLWFMKRPTSKK